MNYIENILKIEKSILTDSRYKHVLSVVECAQKLSKFYCVDYNQVTVAALMHDYYKCHSTEQLLAIINSNDINVFDYSPEILHGIVSSYKIVDLYPNLTSFSIIEAIKYHTTFCIDASDVTKVLFIADYIEPLRVGAHFEKIRNLVGVKTLDEICYEILLQIQSYLNSKGLEISKVSKKVLEGK